MNKSKWLDELLRQDYLVKEENVDDAIFNKMYDQVVVALKLQELVKKEREENYEGFVCIERLREMVEESEQNTSGGKS